MEYFDQILEAASAIRAGTADRPSIGVVLGSGLGDFADRLDRPRVVPYEEIPHWPPSRVVGHAGKLVVGAVKGKVVAALAGRAHGYEGHDPRTVTFGVRVLGILGVKTLLLTNAAGGIAGRLASGALMVLDDHINLTGQNPLVGPNDDRLGPRFPDMSEVYAPRLRRLADEVGGALGLPLQHGVYAGLLGPSFETPAEIRHLRTIGADAVGMSTVLEAIAARHMSMDVLGLSCISNMAAGLQPAALSHLEVMETTRRVRDDFIALLEGIVERL